MKVTVCKIFGRDRLHIGGTCHNRFENCWKRAVPREKFLKDMKAIKIWQKGN